MADSTYHARVTALSMAHVSALADLLRAHGQVDHADHLGAAMTAVYRIVSAQVGPDTLAAAMRWVAQETDKEPRPGAPGATRQ